MMHLISVYAPPSYLEPCLLLSTIWTDQGWAETAVGFVGALNPTHALEKWWGDSKAVKSMRVVREHDSLDAAVDFHVSYARRLHNGGSIESWEAGWEVYQELKEMWRRGKKVHYEDAEWRAGLFGAVTEALEAIKEDLDISDEK